MAASALCQEILPQKTDHSGFYIFQFELINARNMYCHLSRAIINIKE
jgi:hypothetical protein